MDAERCEPAGSWKPFDGRRPPHTRPDQGPTRREIDHLACTDAPPRLHAGLNEEGHMGIRTQAAIGYQDIAWWSARVDRLHPGQIVGEERRDHQLQEEARARMKQPQQARYGNAAPRPWLRRLAERFL
jgi:hypothetical protein